MFIGFMLVSSVTTQHSALRWCSVLSAAATFSLSVTDILFLVKNFPFDLFVRLCYTFLAMKLLHIVIVRSLAPPVLQSALNAHAATRTASDRCAREAVAAEITARPGPTQLACGFVHVHGTRGDYDAPRSLRRRHHRISVSSTPAVVGAVRPARARPSRPP
jgi:hypothetical protein